MPPSCNVMYLNNTTGGATATTAGKAGQAACQPKGGRPSGLWTSYDVPPEGPHCRPARRARQASRRLWPCRGPHGAWRHSTLGGRGKTGGKFPGSAMAGPAAAGRDPGGGRDAYAPRAWWPGLFAGVSGGGWPREHEAMRRWAALGNARDIFPGVAWRSSRGCCDPGGGRDAPVPPARWSGLCAGVCGWCWWGKASWRGGGKRHKQRALRGRGEAQCQRRCAGSPQVGRRR